MRKLIIKSFGPIKEINIDLKRLNVLIGEQSSGKSTINKVACYCSWVEKEISMKFSPSAFQQTAEIGQISNIDEPSYFESRLIEFHKLEGFMQQETYIEYETDILHFKFSKENNSFDFKWKDQWAFVRPKTIYIPSERNIVATIPNWFDVRLNENNVRSFMSDWEEARQFYAGKPLDILTLGVQYVYDKNRQKDTVTLDGGKQLDFTNVSSGLQSVIPLAVLLEYVTDGIFHEKNRGSVSGKASQNQAFDKIYEYLLNNWKSKEQVLNEDVNSKDKDGFPVLINNHIVKFDKKEQADKGRLLFQNYLYFNYTNIFLEEPEQNLYPTTQKDLIGRLISLTNQDREHSLFLTTHSPYVLTSLNNLIYAAEVGKKHRAKAAEVIPEQYWLNFEEVAAWYVNDGMVECILDQELKLIKAEVIDGVSSMLNADYDRLMDLEYEV